MFVRYKVNWYFDGQSCNNQGFVQAGTFAEAVQKIEADYDDIESIDIKWISESNNCLDDDAIEDAYEEEEEQSGAGPAVFDAIKQGLEETVALEKE